MDKHSRKILVLLKFLVPLVLAAGFSTTSVAAVIYNVDRTVASGRITGTIETNGATGVLTSADIIDWNLTVDADGDPATFGQLLGPLSGNNSSFAVSGSVLTATPTALFFDFSITDFDILQIITTAPGPGVVWQLQASAPIFHDELIGDTFGQASVVHPEVQQQIATTAAALAPVTYSFTTGDALTNTRGCPSCLFAGQSVSGTFVYDRNVPVIGTRGDETPSPGATIYFFSITDLAGSVAGKSFSDPFGGTVIGNDKFLGVDDILVFFMDPPALLDLIGFDIDGFTLVDMRMTWIEGLNGVGDFLSDQNLPEVLPNFPGGRLILDFVNPLFPGTIFGVVFDGLIVSPVTMDIKPGETPNSINPASMQQIPVAILSTESFNATNVDSQTVAFGPSGAAESHGQGHIEDIDADGDDDLILHFNIQETGIQCGDISATLTGETFGGLTITGTDTINTVNCLEVLHSVHAGGPDVCESIGQPIGCDANYSLVAIMYSDGSVKGQYVDRFAEGGGFHGDIDCLLVNGNDAWVSGIVTQPEEAAGGPFAARVQDNGTSENDPPDQISFSNRDGNATSCTDMTGYPLFPLLQGQVTVR